MPDYGPPNYQDPGRGAHFEPSNGDVSLDALARSDRFLDALAGDHPLPAMGRADYELASLLAGWRDETRYPELTDLVTDRQATQALRRGMSERRGRRGLAVVGSVAAAMLAIGGFGTLTYNAQPGDALYPMRTALFGEPAAVRDDQVALAAQTEMQQVQQLIANGKWEQAAQQLTSISSQVETVEDETLQQELINQWSQLNIQVETRDPTATVPGLPPLVLPDQTLPLTELPGESSETSAASTTAETSAASTTAESTTAESTTAGPAAPPSSETSTETSVPVTTTVEASTPTPTSETAPPPASPPPTSQAQTTVVPPAPSTPVSAEPPPPVTSTFLLPTTTTTTPPQVEVPTQSVPEPAIEQTTDAVEIPEAPEPAVSGGDSESTR
ncbi:MAG: anti-sigma-D factor RsdA [Mycobacterium sp.]